ncbi:MAG: hypothetical protein LIP12_00030 [Clostridiales bacterium]|nr:hypothetical protein [Clostridiales bacterium]
MELYFPCALDPNRGLTMQQLRKFFKLCLRYQHERTENEKSVHELEQYLADYVLACKNAAESMEDYLKRNLLDPKNFIDKEERRRVKEQNARLYKELKNAGKLYERSMKILTIWADMKKQYSM